MLKIEGERIYLRDHLNTDLNNYHKWRSDEEIMRYSLLPRSLSLDDSFVYLAYDVKSAIRTDRKYFFLAIVLKPNDIYIGDAGFILDKVNENGGVVEIGYFVYKEYWNKGYGTEATILIIDYIFENFNVHKIIANCDARNLSSEKVMIKAGMIKEGYFKKERFLNGEWTDNIKYCLLKEDWLKKFK